MLLCIQGGILDSARCRKIHLPFVKITQATQKSLSQNTHRIAIACNACGAVYRRGDALYVMTVADRARRLT